MKRAIVNNEATNTVRLPKPVLDENTVLDEEHRAVVIGPHVWGIARSIKQAKANARREGAPRGTKAVMQVRPKDVQVSTFDGSTQYTKHVGCDICTPGAWIATTL